tara:strand:+ start:16736 stop:17026 length:291 start_codon:yes stop_codon:yes gene_type:complete
MNFQQYYQHYLALHQNKMCRRLHVLGQATTLLVLLYAILSKTWLLLLAVPFVVYPFAWSGHFFFEKNTPAAFSNPLWAKACDWLMLRDWILGRIER